MDEPTERLPTPLWGAAGPAILSLASFGVLAGSGHWDEATKGAVTSWAFDLSLHLGLWKALEGVLLLITSVIPAVLGIAGIQLAVFLRRRWIHWPVHAIVSFLPLLMFITAIIQAVSA